MLYVRVSSHEYLFVISPEFPRNDHCYSSRPGDHKHNSHNRKLPWMYLRPYWHAWPNMLMCESIYVWQTMIRHVRDRLEPRVTFQGDFLISSELPCNDHCWSSRMRDAGCRKWQIHKNAARLSFEINRLRILVFFTRLSLTVMHTPRASNATQVQEEEQLSQSQQKIATRVEILSKNLIYEESRSFIVRVKSLDSRPRAKNSKKCTIRTRTHEKP